MEIQEDLKGTLDGAHSLEEAAQQFVDVVYGNFNESLVLLRVFVTIPMAELPKEVCAFVEDLAKEAGVPMEQTSHVLTLLGTAGIASQWNNRESSKGHQGIPLATPDFVTSIPMMSALLEQLGFELGWIRGAPEIVAHKIGRMSGTFYVPEASSTKDDNGRLIISAQDFVTGRLEPLF